MIERYIQRFMVSRKPEGAWGTLTDASNVGDLVWVTLMLPLPHSAQCKVTKKTDCGYLAGMQARKYYFVLKVLSTGTDISRIRYDYDV
jgi:hypothetical protein